MTAASRLQRISEADLDGLIAELRRQGTTELFLLGSDIEMPASVDQWHQALRDKPLQYQLIEPVEALAERLAELTQLSSLTLWSNEIGAAGAAALAALIQLTSLGLVDNEIGAEGAAALAALTQLTSLGLVDNEIGAEGAAALAALTQLISLNLGYNQIGTVGATALAALTQLTSLDLSNNPVVETTPFATLRRLTSLNLKETNVRDLSPLRPLLERGLEAKWEERGAGNGIHVYDCPLIHPPLKLLNKVKQPFSTTCAK